MEKPTPAQVVPSQVNTAAKLQILSSKLVIVEGRDEEVCLQYWFKRWDIKGVQVAAVGGKEQIALTLGILRLLPEFATITHLLVVRDADDDPQAALASVKGHLQANNFAAPSQSWQWEPPQGHDPALCIAIVPASDQTGALEELLLETVTGDAMLSTTRTFIAEAYATRQAESQPLNEAHRGKATAQAYMVTRIADMRMVGLAAQKDVWDCFHPSLQPLRDLLTQM